MPALPSRCKWGFHGEGGFGKSYRAAGPGCPGLEKNRSALSWATCPRGPALTAASCHLCRSNVLFCFGDTEV
jgi:hypothetical protein